MIRFEPIPEPVNFNSEAAAPGKAWLASHPTGRPKDYWGPFKGTLADGFRNLCAYSAMYEPVGTVDHFVSCAEDRSKAYEWSNYRYASAWLNSSKQRLESAQLLDPFAVEGGWFMLERLHLRDDERVIRQRRAWYRMYQVGEITLEGLRRNAPLIARAVEQANSALPLGELTPKDNA